MVNKKNLQGTSVSAKTLAMRMSLFSVLMAGMLMFTYYRCQLNANLNVKHLDMPIKSWEDILDSKYNLLVYLGSYYLDFFTLAPLDTILSKIYHEKILTIPSEEHINSLGYSGSAAKILDGSSIVLMSSGPYYEELDFCDVMEIKELEYISTTKLFVAFSILTTYLFIFLGVVLILESLFPKIALYSTCSMN